MSEIISVNLPFERFNYYLLFFCSVCLLSQRKGDLICSCVFVINYNSPCSALFCPVQIDDIKQTQRLKQMEEEDHQKRISNTRRTIEDLKAELAKVGDQPDVTPRINEVNVELRHIQVERARIEGEKSDLRREKDNLCAESISESMNQLNKTKM